MDIDFDDIRYFTRNVKRLEKFLREKIKLTTEQKARYVTTYLRDELEFINLHDTKKLKEEYGTDDVLEFIVDILSYPLEHNDLMDMYNHMDDKYFDLATEEQLEAWEQLEIIKELKETLNDN